MVKIEIIFKTIQQNILLNQILKKSLIEKMDNFLNILKKKIKKKIID